MAWSQSNALHGDDVFDHDPSVLNDDTINHQLKDLLLNGKGRIDSVHWSGGNSALKAPARAAKECRESRGGHRALG
jgi:hypothetical protein